MNYLPLNIILCAVGAYACYKGIVSIKRIIPKNNKEEKEDEI